VERYYITVSIKRMKIERLQWFSIKIWEPQYRQPYWFRVSLQSQDCNEALEHLGLDGRLSLITQQVSTNPLTEGELEACYPLGANHAVTFSVEWSCTRSSESANQVALP
jgi:hypothetical protein